MRRVALPVLLAVSLTSACYGTFAATRRVHEFNGTVSSSGVVHTLVMYGFALFPVYSLAVTADVLILNTVEFWTGNNPLALHVKETDTRLASQEQESVVLEKDGNAYTVTAVSPDTMELRVNGQLVGITVVHSDGSLELLDAQRQLVRVVPAKDAQVLLARSSPGAASKE